MKIKKFQTWIIINMVYHLFMRADGTPTYVAVLQENVKARRKISKLKHQVQ